jgi:TetR/AcrR family transcriptional regulator, fatty acid metabolism regulator protein
LRFGIRINDRHKQQAIIEAAIIEFAENGYFQSKISKIAEIAGVSVGSNYLYFKNKEDIVIEIYDQLWSQLSVQLEKIYDRNDLNPIEKLDLTIDNLFESLMVNPLFAMVFVNEQNRLLHQENGNIAKQYKVYLDIAENILRDGVQQGVYKNNIDIELFQVFVTGGLRALLHDWVLNPEDHPINHIRENVKYFAKNGILAHSNKH